MEVIELNGKIKTAIVTFVSGRFYNDMAKITHPNLRAYADRIGAKFFVSKGNEGHKVEHYAKIDVLIEALKYYDRICYIDTDIVIREDAPNIFDQCIYGEIAVFDESPFTDRNNGVFQSFLNQINVSADVYNKKYYNTGVIVMDKSHLHLLEYPEKEIFHFGEQSWINYLFMKHKPTIVELHFDFNRMCCMDTIIGLERFDSYFMHYAGVINMPNMDQETLLKLIKNDLLRWQNDRPKFNYKRNVLVHVQGGMGDQLCAEPVCRYIIEHIYPGENIHISTHWPELFEHLGVPIHLASSGNFKSNKPFVVLKTLRGPEHVSWEFMTHPMCHAVDFASLQAIRQQLPFHIKQIKLVVNNDSLEYVKKLIPCDLKELVLIHPGRGWQSKTFPSKNWQSYIDVLTLNGFKVAVIGKRISETQGIVEVDTSNCIDLIDKLSVKELIALISEAKAVISNDSAPIHIAGAFDHWIGLIATCKNPNYILPFRYGNIFFKAVALERKPIYNLFKGRPTELYGESIEVIPENDLIDALPTPERVLEFVTRAFSDENT